MKNYMELTENVHKIWILAVLIVWFAVCVSCHEKISSKRSAAPDYNNENSENSLDKLNVNYDEYPVSAWQLFRITFCFTINFSIYYCYQLKVVFIRNCKIHVN